jgi:hypothetical protein
MSSMTTPTPWPSWIMSYQRRPVGSAIIAGSPEASSEKKPIWSEWSATTRKSSGRDSWTGRPVELVTCSPRAKR